MLFQIHFKSVLSPWLWELRPEYLITVHYERPYNWGGRYHCCSAIFMSPLLNKIVLPCSHEIGFGHRTSFDWWDVGGRNEVYLFRAKHLTSNSRNVNSLCPYGSILDSTCCCGTDIRLRQQRMFCQHTENCVLMNHGCMNCQWILR